VLPAFIFHPQPSCPAQPGRSHIMTTSQPTFLPEIMKTSRDMWSKGWAEANAGNISYRLQQEQVRENAAFFRTSEWVQMPAGVPGLGGEHFLVTGTGRFLRNIELHPDKNLGVIELDPTGMMYRIVWGYKPTGAPTSELAAHMLVQAIRKQPGSMVQRAVIHTHAPNLVALSNAMDLDSRTLTLLLWQVHAECIVAFPDGVEFIPWMLPGSVELAEATARALEKRRATVWQFHGILAVGRNLDAAFGLIDTVEKAAGIYVRAVAAGGVRNKLSVDQLRQLARHFKVAPDESILAGGE
jgi:rhamnulose-1-phosphate aldolase